MINKLVTSSGVGEDISRKIWNLVSQSKSLEKGLPEGVQLHYFASCPILDNITGSKTLHVFPLQSKLFHQALMSSNIGSVSTSQALRDAFLVANYHRDDDRNVSRHHEAIGEQPRKSGRRRIGYGVTFLVSLRRFCGQ